MSTDSTWLCDGPVRRHAAAAEMWMEMSGRRQAVANADARGLVSKVAEAYDDPDPQPARYAKAGLVAGALAGGVGAGLLARHLNASALKNAVQEAPKHFAHPVDGVQVAGRSALTHALGGGVIGGAMGGVGGLAHGVRKAMDHAQERREQESAQEHKAASAFKDLVVKHPAAAGATALGLPAAVLGGISTYRKHRPQAGGDSRAHVDAMIARQHHEAHISAAGREGAHDRLKRRYLAIKEELLADAARHPRASALAGALVFGVPLARVGAKYGPRLLS